MTLTKDTNILIIGLGVIGGSYAKALTKQGYCVNCITLEQRDIDYALEHKMILKGAAPDDKEMIAQADLIILAIYPDNCVKWVKENADYIKPTTLITDVSGVKQCVVDPIQKLLEGKAEFISAHPMAGREQSGVEFSDDSVFIGANFIITPTDSNSQSAIDFCRDFAKLLGFARVSILSPQEHDRMIAFLSQLTHCIAVTLMTANQTPDMEKFTGDSFRDLTRIAKINDLMWSKLFIANKQALLEEMDSFIAEFSRFRDMLAHDDADSMRRVMRLSTARRSLFDKPTQNS
ncbi:MAG: prephenate dehydrogenase [Clostridia bacterium]|nr:prephenate dehydrogenase [Clostridia bacterium]